MESTFIINGRARGLRFDPQEVLLHVLRRAGHVEVKEGCGEGACGACVVLLDGVLVNSCQVLAASAAGRSVTTVTALGSIHDPHVIQEAFVEAGAVQCGFCTPGMVLATHALLSEEPAPAEERIRKALDGNLCRCTGYARIVEAVRLAGRRLKSRPKPRGGRQ